MVLVSDATKQVVLLELTVPWEDQLKEAFERKLTNAFEEQDACQ